MTESKRPCILCVVYEKMEHQPVALVKPSESLYAAGVDDGLISGAAVFIVASQLTHLRAASRGEAPKPLASKEHLCDRHYKEISVTMFLVEPVLAGVLK